MIVLLLINLLVLGASGLVAKSLFGTIARDRVVNEKKGVAEKQVKEDLAAAPNLVDAFNNLGSKAALVADALPNAVDYPSLIVTLENMTNAASTKLKNITAAPDAGVSAVPATGTAPAAASTAGPTPQTFAFSINTTSNYDSLLKLLGEFETSARPMRVTGLQLTGGGSSMSAQIDAQTYYQDKAKLPFSTETVK